MSPRLLQNPREDDFRDSRLLSAVSYASIAFIFPFFFLLVPYLVSILIYIFVKEDKFVRFNALQSFLLATSYTIVFVLLSLTILGLIVSIPSIILFWIFCAWAAIEAYNGKIVHIPLITDITKTHI
ncbi:MAG: DUF4870 domain-containing protein [Candidatus Anstonellales archaeon]